MGDAVVETHYRLALSLAIDDPARLWTAAATLALQSPGMTMDDVVDTIGSRELPQLDDCLALLLQPERFAGCTLHTLEIDRPAAPRAQARVAEISTSSTASTAGSRARSAAAMSLASRCASTAANGVA